MPEVENGEVRLHYEVGGSEQGEVILLANSLGSNLHIWDKVLPAFENRFRVVRFDLRGHGKSSTPKGPYTIVDLGHDALLLLDHLGVERANVCGLSIGGMMAMWLGVHA